MGTQVKVNSDILSKLTEDLIATKSSGMGSDKKTDVFCMTEIDEMVYRIPLSYAYDNFGVKIKSYEDMYRAEIDCSIELGSENRDYQHEIYSELTQMLSETHFAYLSLYCGAGKTMIGVKLWAELGIKGAFICDGTLIFDQFVNVIKTFTNARVECITTPVDVLPEADVYVMMITCCGNMSPKTLKPIQFLCVDEAAYFCTSIRMRAILNFSPSYVMGMCAEITRNDKMHVFLPYLFGNNIIRRISKKPFQVWLINTPYKPNIRYMKWGGKLDWGEVLNSLAINKKKNDLIVAICRMRPSMKIVVGCKRKSQAQTIHEALIGWGENSALMIGNTKSFPACRILVGTYSKIGKGFDDKNLCKDWDQIRFGIVVLAADLGKPEQFIGRGFRHDKPEVYDLVDDYTTLRKHSTARNKWYLSRNATIKEMYMG